MQREFRRINKVLAPISFLEKTDAVVNHAQRIAEVNRAEILLFHVVPTQSYRLHRDFYRPEQSGGANEDHAERVAIELLEKLGNRYLSKVKWRPMTVRSSNPAKAILEAQNEISADLIVVSKSEAGEVGARLQGGLHEKLIRSAPCPVWSVSPLERFAHSEEVRNVLAFIAFDRGSVVIARFAGSIAQAQRGRVRFLHVLPTESSLEIHREDYGLDSDQPVDMLRAQTAAKRKLEEFAVEQIGDIPHETAVAVGDRAAAILAEEKIWSPDLIVMPTAGHTGFFQLVLGSAAEAVSRRASCDVVTIRIH